MRKLAFCGLILALATPAFAGNLDPDAAISWNAPWGAPATVTDLGGGVINLDIATDNGSAGIFWRLPAFPSEIVAITGTWEGDCGGNGWAEVMMFTSTEGWSDADIATRIDTGATGDIVAKHDSWALGPKVFSEDISAAQISPQEIHATCTEVIVALKVGNTANVTYDLTFVPEPAMMLLMGLPALFLRRRRL